MARVRKANLKKIFDALWEKLMPEDLEWIREHRAPRWTWLIADKDTSGFNVHDFSFAIQDTVDAKLRDTERTFTGQIKNRGKPDYWFALGIPLPYAWELARIFGIELLPREKKDQLISRILTFVDSSSSA